MKKLWILCLLAVGFASCDPGDNEYPVFAIGPVDEVEAPATYRVDSISEFVVRYSRPNTCHIFNGFYYVANGDTRTIAVEYMKMNRNDCEVEPNPVYEVPLRFKPRHSGTYLLKFWTGEDQNGDDQFIEIEAVVPE